MRKSTFKKQTNSLYYDPYYIPELFYIKLIIWLSMETVITINSDLISEEINHELHHIGTISWILHWALKLKNKEFIMYSMEAFIFFWYFFLPIHAQILSFQNTGQATLKDIPVTPLQYLFIGWYQHLKNLTNLD